MIECDRERTELVLARLGLLRRVEQIDGERLGQSVSEGHEARKPRGAGSGTRQRRCSESCCIGRAPPSIDRARRPASSAAEISPSAADEAAPGASAMVRIAWRSRAGVDERAPRRRSSAGTGDARIDRDDARMRDSSRSCGLSEKRRLEPKAVPARAELASHHFDACEESEERERAPKNRALRSADT